MVTRKSVFAGFFFAVVTATMGSDLWVQEDVGLNWKFESEKELL